MYPPNHALEAVLKAASSRCLANGDATLRIQVAVSLPAIQSEVLIAFQVCDDLKSVCRRFRSNSTTALLVKQEQHNQVRNMSMAIFFEQIRQSLVCHVLVHIHCGSTITVLKPARPDCALCLNKSDCISIRMAPDLLETFMHMVAPAELHMC